MKNFKEFLKFIVPYVGRLITSVLFNIISTIGALFTFAMVIPFLGILFNKQQIVTELLPFEFSSHVIQNNFYYYLSQVIINHGEHTALILVGFVVVFAVIIKSLFSYLGNYTLVPLRTGVVKDIRNALYTKIVYLPMRFFSEERKGDLISRMVGDVKELEATVVNSLQKAIKSPVELIIYISTLLMMNTKLTLFSLVLLPFSGYVIGKIGKTLRAKAIKGQESLGNLLINMEETLFGIRIIKAFTAEPKAEERFFKENDNYSNILNKIFRRKFLAQPISEFMGTLVVVIVMWFGGSMVLRSQGALSPQEFIAYIVIFSQIISPAKAISNIYFEISKGMGAFDRIKEILDVKDTVKNIKGGNSITKFDDKIEYDNISFSYKNEGDIVLKDINLTIKKGETVAIVGQSGAGKSTLVDLLPRFYDVENGEIRLDGVPLTEYNVMDLRGLIGVVSQEQILFNDTIFNNIAFGVDDVSEEDVIKAAKVANAHEFIIKTEYGYNTIIGDRGGKLSGGQRQRLTIARAILRNPPILILDEATSALDVESEVLVQDALDNLMLNRTSIVIAHRLSTVKNADLVCVMRDGKIIEKGKHSELLDKGGHFKQLYSQQMG